VCWDVGVTQLQDRSGPDFEPPPGPVSDSAVLDESTPPRRRIGFRRFAGRATLLVVLLVVAVGFHLRHRGQDDSVVDVPALAAAAPPPPLIHPLPTLGPRPAELLLQQHWAGSDDVYAMELRDLTFSFRTPGSWGCMRSALAGVRWVCTDETGLINGTRPAWPSRAMVQSDECRAPCAAKDYADVLSRLHALSLDTAGMRVVDSRTRVADRVDPDNADLREYRMSRTYDSDGDGTLDRHLWVQIEVNPTDRIPVQKMLGELFDATR